MATIHRPWRYFYRRSYAPEKPSRRPPPARRQASVSIRPTRTPKHDSSGSYASGEDRTPAQRTERGVTMRIARADGVGFYRTARKLPYCWTSSFRYPIDWRNSRRRSGHMRGQDLTRHKTRAPTEPGRRRGRRGTMIRMPIARYFKLAETQHGTLSLMTTPTVTGTGRKVKRLTEPGESVVHTIYQRLG